MNILLLAHDYRPEQVAFRRISAMVRYLVERGDKVTLAAVRLKSTVGLWGETIVALGSPIEVSEKVAAASKALSPGQGMLDRSTIEWIRQVFRSHALREAAENADVVISTYGPAGPTWAAYFLSLRFQKPLVLDFRDVPESRTGDGLIQRQLVRVLEGFPIRRAALVSSVGDVLADYFEERHGKRPITVFNGWVESDLSLTETTNIDSNGKYIYYAGSIYNHQINAFDVVCGALSATRDLSLRVRLLRGNIDELLAIARSRGIEGRVEVLPPSESQVVEREAAGARAVLVLEALHYRAKWQAGTVTGKLLGLIAGRRPGIAVCRDDSELAGIASRFPWWSVASDSGALSALLLADPPQFDLRVGSDLLESFKMERQIGYFRTRLEGTVFPGAAERGFPHAGRD